jgi:hypothetical protein
MTDPPDPYHRSGGEAIELWTDGTGGWRWQYMNPGVGVVLPSNRGYETRERALAAIRLAYPGVPVLERDPNAGHRSPRGMGPGVAVLSVAAVVLVVTAVAAVTGLIGLALAWRRAGRMVRAVRRP